MTAGCVLASLLALALPSVSRAAGGSWTRIGPPTGAGSLSVYDAVREQWLLGNWALDCAHGTGWRYLPISGPGSDILTAVLFDSRRDLLMGLNSTGALWILDLDGDLVWSSQTVSGQHPMAGPLVYDSAQDRVLELRPDGAVQQLPLGGVLAWSPLATASPFAGAPTHAVFDSALDAVAVTVPVDAGEPYLTGDFYDDFWKLSLAGSPMWSFVARDGKYDATEESVVLDPIRHRVLLLGGFVYVDSPSWPYIYDTSRLVVAASLTSGDSTVVNLPSMPLPRAGHGAVYDPQRDRLLVHGGWWQSFTAGYICCFSDVIQLSGSGTGWSELEAGWEFQGSSMVFDPVRRELVRSARTDPWIHPEGKYWFARSTIQLHDHRGRLRHYLRDAGTWGNGIFDPGGDRFVFLEGAYDCGGITRPPSFQRSLQVVSRAESAMFAPAESGTIPPILVSSNVMHDGARQRMLVFGGEKLEQPSCAPPPVWATDVWALSLDDTWTWTALPAGGTIPPPGQQMFSIYDPMRDRLLAWAPDSSRAWLLPLATLEWSYVDLPESTSFHRVGGYDSRRDRLLTFDSDWNLWALSLESMEWTQPATRGPHPPPVDPFPYGPPGEPDLMYDAVDDRLYVAPGWVWYYGVPPPGLYALDFDDVTTDVPPARASLRAGLTLRLASRSPTPAAPLVEFTLPTGESAILQLLDLAGRVRWRRAVGPLGPGPHRVTAGEGAPLAPGIYVARLTAGADARSIKVVVLR